MNHNNINRILEDSKRTKSARIEVSEEELCKVLDSEMEEIENVEYDVKCVSSRDCTNCVHSRITTNKSIPGVAFCGFFQTAVKIYDEKDCIGWIEIDNE